MAIPSDYVERVYAGVLGKLIGVYLGRPVEGWSFERIAEAFGEIDYYVHEQAGQPLVVADDDISGTFTFVRALADHGPGLTSRQVGETWLNYIVPGRTILWWGGLGLSTEHTAYLRLRRGIPAPQSGSMALNGKVVAEQIGAQIFIDGWAMVAPGDPERAAALAGEAARVSHDGEAVWAAQLLAAMEAQAFCERSIERLIETGLSIIPKDCTIARMIRDVQEWAAREPDWRAARRNLDTHYGYHKYPGNCHVIPNHGVVILSLLYGRDDFRRALAIATTAGWDTDCNAGNVGCLMGIKNGLEGIGPDWREPVADRLYLPTADGGRAITDAVREAYAIVNMGRSLQGLGPLHPKAGARFHFEAPDAVQGFRIETGATAGLASIRNVSGHSRAGTRALAIDCRQIGPGTVTRVVTATFTPEEALRVPTYRLVACPTIYPGQVVRMGLSADDANPAPVGVRPFLRYYDAEDQLARLDGNALALPPGAYRELEWTVPDTGGCPIAEIGLELAADERMDACVYLDYLTWSGTPTLRLTRPAGGGRMWRHAWVDAVDHWRFKGTYELAQDEGVGLLIHGTTDWTDYRVETALTPYMAKSMGVAARVQGMRRYLALLLCDDSRARLIRMYDRRTVLAEADVPWRPGERYGLCLEVEGRRLRASVDGRRLFDLDAPDDALATGGIALVCEEGCITGDEVRVESLARRVQVVEPLPA